MIMRVPISNINQLAQLDDFEIVEGYLDGMAGDPSICGGNRSISYWHGWRNGMMDSNRMPIDCAARQLAQEICQTGYLQQVNKKP